MPDYALEFRGFDRQKFDEAVHEMYRFAAHALHDPHNWVSYVYMNRAMLKAMTQLVNAVMIEREMPSYLAQDINKILAMVSKSQELEERCFADLMATICQMSMPSLIIDRAMLDGVPRESMVPALALLMDESHSKEG